MFLPLTEEQKGQICGILSAGCDRQTAANLVGCSLADIRRQMEHDADFVASIRRAVARAELNQMRNVLESAKEKKDWRASVWWLERCSPERYARRDPGAITSRQLKAFVTILAEMLRDAVTCDADRARILARLQTISESVEQMLRDTDANLVEPWDLADFSAASDAAQGTTGGRFVQQLLDFDDSDQT
jgi:hypothetical protein